MVVTDRTGKDEADRTPRNANLVRRNGDSVCRMLERASTGRWTECHATDREREGVE